MASLPTEIVQVMVPRRGGGRGGALGVADGAGELRDWWIGQLLDDRSDQRVLGLVILRCLRSSPDRG